MKKRTHKMFVEDILQAMEKIERFIKGLTYETFAQNDMAVDAVIRNIAIIGEASRNIPKKIRDRYPDIPWRRMIGLRNITVHEYFGIDLRIIWQIITKNIPETKPKVVTMLKSLADC